MGPKDLAEVLRHLPVFKDDNLLSPAGAPEDAAVYRIAEDRLMVFTTDFFTPVVDDPYTFGRIAAANAFSDCYAMGAKPVIALNLAAFPVRTCRLDELNAILGGGADAAAEAGCVVAGGHTIDDHEPKYGMAVVGFCKPSELLEKRGAAAGDGLFLTKKLGTGIIATAIKRGGISGEGASEAVESMKALNDIASGAAVELGLKCATDITGYGLFGHLLEICEASKVSASINFGAVPFFEEVAMLAKKGFVPGGTRANLDFVSEKLDVDGDFSEDDLLAAADAQTSGGLLIAVPGEKKERFREMLVLRKQFFAEIGSLTEGDPSIVLKK